MTDTAPVANIRSVTDLHLPGDATPDAAADRAAAAAGVRVREVSLLEDLREVYRLYDGIWRPDPKNPPVTTELLRALTKAGNYAAGAYDGTELVGACVGFFAVPDARTGGPLELHSHIAGVSKASLGRSVGFALKQHQRAWALRRGVARIAWTFDPLVSRNAYFNLAKLAALPAEYLPNFYGGMHDGINGSDESDRLLVHWDLASPDVQAASVGRLRAVDAEELRTLGASVGLSRSADGRPQLGTVEGATVLVAVPSDIEAIRSVDPAGAQAWRMAVREVLGAAMAQGARVVGFDRSGWYVVAGAGSDVEVRS
jgi:predicted GNAT superfamily acetyltransferase